MSDEVKKYEKRFGAFLDNDVSALVRALDVDVRNIMPLIDYLEEKVSYSLAAAVRKTMAENFVTLTRRAVVRAEALTEDGLPSPGRSMWRSTVMRLVGILAIQLYGMERVVGVIAEDAKIEAPDYSDEPLAGRTPMGSWNNLLTVSSEYAEDADAARERLIASLFTVGEDRLRYLLALLQEMLPAAGVGTGEVTDVDYEVRP